MLRIQLKTLSMKLFITFLLFVSCTLCFGQYNGQGRALLEPIPVQSDSLSAISSQRQLLLDAGIHFKKAGGNRIAAYSLIAFGAMLSATTTVADNEQMLLIGGVFSISGIFPLIGSAFHQHKGGKLMEEAYRQE